MAQYSYVYELHIRQTIKQKMKIYPGNYVCVNFPDLQEALYRMPCSISEKGWQRSVTIVKKKSRIKSCNHKCSLTQFQMYMPLALLKVFGQVIGPFIEAEM